MMPDSGRAVVVLVFYAVALGLVGWLTVQYLRQHLREHWRLTLLVWLATLPVPLFYFHPRGTPPFWFRVLHLYDTFFLHLLPAVFTHTRGFIETLPESLLVFVFLAEALCVHVSLCSWLAHFLARRALTKRLFRWLI